VICHEGNPDFGKDFGKDFDFTSMSAPLKEQKLQNS
jgi:hypothetical protein